MFTLYPMFAHLHEKKKELENKNSLDKDYQNFNYTVRGKVTLNTIEINKNTIRGKVVLTPQALEKIESYTV